MSTKSIDPAKLAQDLHEQGVFEATKNALANKSRHELINALSYTLEDVSGVAQLIEAATRIDDLLAAFDKELQRTVQTLQGPGLSYPQENLKPWVKGIVSGLQTTIFQRTEPMVSRTWSVNYLSPESTPPGPPPPAQG